MLGLFSALHHFANYSNCKSNSVTHLWRERAKNNIHAEGREKLSREKERSLKSVKRQRFEEFFAKELRYVVFLYYKERIYKSKVFKKKKLNYTHNAELYS